MNNNDILRRIRYTFSLKDRQVVEILKLADLKVTQEQVNAWMKKRDDEKFATIYDDQMDAFLNGFIFHKRGKKNDRLPSKEKQLTNNIIFRKLKVALKLRDEDVVDIYKLANVKVSNNEVNRFFKKPDNENYLPCGDKRLRDFLFGMQLKYRVEEE